MKNIIIKQKNFNDLFDDTLGKLELTKLRNKADDILFESKSEMLNWISSLHRQFHYDVCMLKEKLEKSE